MYTARDVQYLQLHCVPNHVGTSLLPQDWSQ